MMAPLKSDDVTEIVTIIENETNTRLSGDEVARRVIKATEDYRRDFAAQNRRDEKKSIKEFVTAASKVRNALDVILAHAGPEADAESQTLTRLADHLGFHLERPNRLAEIVMRLMELRDATDRTLEDAARYSAADVSDDPEAEIIRERNFRLRGAEANPASDQYLQDCTAIWREATGKKLVLNLIGGNSKNRKQVADSPRARYLQACLRLIGDNGRSLKSIRSWLRRLNV